MNWIEKVRNSVRLLDGEAELTVVQSPRSEWLWDVDFDVPVCSAWDAPALLRGLRVARRLGRKMTFRSPADWKTLVRLGKRIEWGWIADAPTH